MGGNPARRLWGTQVTHRDIVTAAPGPPLEIGAYATVAPELVELGYDPTPCKGKRPILSKWGTRPNAALDFQQHYNANIGVVLGGAYNLIAIDIDVPFEPAAGIIKEWIVENLPAMPERIGHAPKYLFVARSEGPRSKARSATFMKADPETGEILCDSSGSEIRIAAEILAEGQQFIADGIHPDTGENYLWPNDHLLDYRADELPVVSDDLIEDLMEFVGQVLNSHFVPNSPESKLPGGLSLGLTESPKSTLLQISDALNFISADDYDRWIMIGLAMRNSYGSSEDVLDTWRIRKAKQPSDMRI